MKRLFYTFVLLTAMAATFVACSKGDKVELTSHCFITNFKVTALKRTVHTKSSTGVDSTYYTITNASAVRFAIDHRAGTITNVDMLPTGSILDAVLVTVSAQGTAAYASISDTTSWTVHTEKDSINFTEPVIFRVMATDGKSYRDYRVTLNVRDNNADGFTWTKICPIDGFADKTAAKLLIHEAQGQDSDRPTLFSQTATGENYVSFPTGHHAISPFPTSWETVPCEGLTAGRVESAVSFDHQLWMSNDAGQVYRSEDGRRWTLQPQSDDKQVALFAASGTALYAVVSADGATTTAMSQDGTNWQPTPNSELPFSRVSAAIAYAQNNGNHRVLALSDAFDDASDKPLFVWSLLEGHDEPWIAFNDQTAEYPLPRWQHPVVTTYNGWLMAMGDADRAGKHKALDVLYISHDNGLNWKENAYLSTPAELVGKAGAITAVGSGQYVWIIADNQLWALSYNSYGE